MKIQQDKIIKTKVENKLLSLEKEIKNSSANLEKLLIDQKKLSALIKKLSKRKLPKIFLTRNKWHQIFKIKR